MAMRSLLFVPATRPDFVEKAIKGQADGICLDLEDGVAPDQKAHGRELVGAAVTAINASGKSALLRINDRISEISHDLKNIPASLNFIVLPMASSRHQINQLGQWLDQTFGDGGPLIIAMVEDATGLYGIVHDNRPLTHRLSHLALGTEDFAASQGCAPDAAPIHAGFQTLLHFAAQWNLQVLGYPGSIAEFRHLEAFGDSVRAGQQAGAVGGFAIHPKQVDVLNEAFEIPEAERDRASAIVEAFEAALQQGLGAIQLDGKMIDRPVYLAARKIMARA